MAISTSEGRTRRHEGTTGLWVSKQSVRKSSEGEACATGGQFPGFV